MPLTPATHAYIGTKACGCVVAVVADTPELVHDTARIVYGFILDGLAVTHVDADAVKDRFQRCPHTPEPTPTEHPSLYTVHAFVTSYVLADDEEDAEDIMDDHLLDAISDVKVDMFVQRTTQVEPAYLDSYPYASEEGVEQTCREILAETELATRQIPLTLE